MIKAVIFDVDGTMVNSEPLHVTAWNKALQTHHHQLRDLSAELQATMAGKKPAAIAREMVHDLELNIDPEALLQEKTEIFMNLIRTDLQGMPGIIKCVKDLKESGYKLAIGTSLTKDYLAIVLQTLTLENYFDVIVTGDEIKNGKPHPDTYLVVAKNLKLDPKECLVIEDAQSGIQSAKAAGCLCIALKNPHALFQNTAQADKEIISLEEITNTFVQKLNG